MNCFLQFPFLYFFRNYLQGRATVNALLGASELDKALPNRDIHIYVGTWNMNGQVSESSRLLNLNWYTFFSKRFDRRTTLG